MNNIENATNNFGDKVVRTANNVADGFKDATQSTVDALKHTFHDQTLTDDASQYVKKGMDAAHDMGEQVKSAAMKCAHDCGHCVSEKPMASVAIAAGVGALLALLLLKHKH